MHRFFLPTVRPSICHHEYFTHFLGKKTSPISFGEFPVGQFEVQTCIERQVDNPTHTSTRHSGRESVVCTRTTASPAYSAVGSAASLDTAESTPAHGIGTAPDPGPTLIDGTDTLAEQVVSLPARCSDRRSHRVCICKSTRCDSPF